jgi:isopentenyl-diphosphate delta-isomerase type 1
MNHHAPGGEGGQQPASLESEHDVVVLLDEHYHAIGTAPRLLVHGRDTPLHLAFSCYIVNDSGEVLVTRRALSKRTWPGVWTNSCCGHPRWNEPIEDAVRRRVREELGIRVGAVLPAVPDFRYRATDSSGVTENEFCPVFIARVETGEIEPDPEEVEEHVWMPWPAFVQTARSAPAMISPWAAEQALALYARFGDDLRTGPSTAVDAGSALAEVRELVVEAGEEARDIWRASVGADNSQTLGGATIPEHLMSLVNGGKEVRPLLCIWGYIATGGEAGTDAYEWMIRSAAALEWFHLFALVHDDVMDEALTRRGRATVHEWAKDLHRQADAAGSDARFGDSIAVLVGDLALTQAFHLVAALPSPFAALWYELAVELYAGQSFDLICAAERVNDGHAVGLLGQLKTASYSVRRPLQLGALAAGATPAQSATLDRYAAHVGRAFSMRDDYLGVWGDPTETGKAAQADLAQGKATCIVELGLELLDDAGRALLERVGTGLAAQEDVVRLTAALEQAGVRAAVEERITDEHDLAIAALGEGGLVAAGVQGLRVLADQMAYRTR